MLWSDTQTTFAGTILARGGTQGGDGGFVETSSHGQLAFTGNVNAWRAARLYLERCCSIQRTFLIEPTRAAAGRAPSAALLANNDVTITIFVLTLQFIVVATEIIALGAMGAHVTWNANTTLTLSAYHDILFQPGSSFPTERTQIPVRAI